MNIYGAYDHGELVDYTETDENAKIHDCPHYTEPRFKEAQTIFGKREKGLHYVYSDRLYQWDWDKHKQAIVDANLDGSLSEHTAKWYRKYLSSYFDKEILLPHIMAGFNLSNGHSYCVFGYKEA